MNSTLSDQRRERVTFLKEVPLFKSVKEEIITQIADDFRERKYRKGDTIFHQGDQSQSLFIVKEGRLRIYHNMPNGAETTVNILLPRQLMGEFALIDGEPRSATSKAVIASVLLEIYRDRFLNHLENIPGLAFAMCRQLTKKARWTSIYAETIARLDVRSRLLTFLLHFNEELGQELAPDWHCELDLGLTQNELASLVAANRGWVASILSQWREEGLLDYSGGKITFLDLGRAQKVLEEAMLHLGREDW